jgi:F0F1-type ATP synthase membrane subunit b/b'
MKIKTLGVVGCLLVATFSGCNKDQSASNPPSDVPKAAENAGAQAKPVVDAAVKEVDPAVSHAIDTAKSFVTEKKYQEALNTLAELKDVKLTPEQQKVVDDLKAQIQKLMAADAGNLMGK